MNRRRFLQTTGLLADGEFKPGLRRLELGDGTRVLVAGFDPLSDAFSRFQTQMAFALGIPMRLLFPEPPTSIASDEERLYHRAVERSMEPMLRRADKIRNLLFVRPLLGSRKRNKRRPAFARAWRNGRLIGGG